MNPDKPKNNEPEQMIRPVRCHFCHEPMYYANDHRHVPEIQITLTPESNADTIVNSHVSCWNARQTMPDVGFLYNKIAAAESTCKDLNAENTRLKNEIIGLNLSTNAVFQAAHPNRVCESMTRLNISRGGWNGSFRIRVWSAMPELGEFVRSDLNSWAKAFSTALAERDRCANGHLPSWTAEAKLMMRDLQTFKDVSAVEILDENGNGLILYPDWS